MSRYFIVMCENNSFSPFTLRFGTRLVTFDRPAVMGILNATADSFYDGGRHLDASQWAAHALQMHEEGADIVDIGVVSTRPGAQLLSPEVEAERLVPVVKAVRAALPSALISVDTCYALPARVAVEAGADMVNDISGGAFDEKMFPTVAELQVPYVLMHNLGTPDHMQDNPQYDDIFQSVVSYFSEKLDRLRRMGVADVVIDPGFGFSKTLEHNYQLFSCLAQLRTLFPTTPLLVAISRKSMIYKLLQTDPSGALTGTTALHAAALLAGAQMLRVHDVKAARQTIEVIGQLLRCADASVQGNTFNRK